VWGGEREGGVELMAALGTGRRREGDEGVLRGTEYLGVELQLWRRKNLGQVRVPHLDRSVGGQGVDLQVRRIKLGGS
jgi:hypothetical protein